MGREKVSREKTNIPVYDLVFKNYCEFLILTHFSIFLVFGNSHDKDAVKHFGHKIHKTHLK